MTALTRLAAAAALLCAAMLAGCDGKSAKQSLQSAKELVGQRSYAAATVELKAALQAAPDLPEARFMLGQVLLLQGREADAAVELAKAKDAGYDPDRVVPLLARAMIGSGRASEVVQNLGRVELTSPSARAGLRTAVALALVQLKRMPDAVKTLDEALKLDPKLPWALQTKARFLVLEGKVDEAFAVLETSLAADPANGEALILRGLLQRYIRKDIEAARKSFVLAAQDPASEVQARTSLIQLALSEKKPADARAQLAELKKQHARNAQTHYLEALVAYAEKDYARAESMVETLLRSLPDNPQLLLLGGAAGMQRGGLIAAETKLGKAVQLMDNAPAARLLLGEVYLRMGQPEKTLNVLKPVLEGGQVDASIHALAGRAYLHAGRPAEAESHFTAAAKLNPNDFGLRTALALVELAKGNSTQAFDTLQNIASQDAAETADMALISAHLRRREFDEALPAIQRLEAKQPGKPLANHLRGLALNGKGDQAGARAAFEAALKVDPGYYSSMAALAALDLTSGQLVAARNRLEAAIKADPKNTAARMAAMDVMARQNVKPEELLAAAEAAIRANPFDAAPYVARIGLLRRSGNVKAAVTAAHEAVAARPNSPEILEAAGSAFAEAGDHQQAISAFNRLASVAPNSALPHLRIADVHTRRGDRAAIDSSLSRALDVAPDSIEVHRRLIREAMTSRDYTKALASARDLQKRRPESALGFVFEGDIEAARKAWPAAAAAYRKGMGKRDVMGRPQIRLHAMTYASGDKSGAARFAEEWIKANPKDLRFREYLGSHALQLGDKVLAETRYRDILAVQPQHAIALNNVAWLMADRGAKGAVEMAQRSVALAKDAPQFLDTLALAHASEGQWAKAVEVQARAVAALPDRADLRLTLARYAAKAGDKARATAEIQVLQKLGDQVPEKAKAAELLKSLAG